MSCMFSIMIDSLAWIVVEILDLKVVDLLLSSQLRFRIAIINEDEFGV